MHAICCTFKAMDEHYEASLFWANRGLYITFKTSKVFPSLATETMFLPYMIQKKILRSENTK